MPKITDLTAATSIGDGDVLLVVQGGVTKRVPASLIATQTELDAARATAFTVVTTTSGVYPSARPAGAGRVWFDDPAVTPPSWALARDRWASA